MKTGELLDRNSPRMTENTKFEIKNPIKVLVHGWMGTTHEKESFCTYLNEGLHIFSYVFTSFYVIDVNSHTFYESRPIFLFSIKRSSILKKIKS